MTPRQEQIVTVIRAFAASYGRPPTQREIASRVSLSVATVQHHLENIEKAGLIRRTTDRQRSIVLVGETCPTCGRGVS